MRRIVAVFLSFLGVLLTIAWGIAAPVSVVNSKHNMSSVASSGTGSIHAATAGGTDEVCVFCHTPHAGNTKAPLWNRNDSVATYQVYTSDVLGGLGYAPAEDPSSVSAPGYAVHVKTRLCLTCHDGTIALGSLVNLPYNTATGKKLVANVAMVNANADGTMPNTAAGYIGIDLRDDHPVAIPHDSTKDQELRTSILGGAIYLYQYSAGAIIKTTAAGNTNYVECTTCHNAHDNQYGSFLVQSNVGSAICTNCHNKQTTGATPAHDNSTVPYNFDGNSAGTRVMDVKCKNCHYSHKAGVNPGSPPYTPAAAPFGRYLLSFQAEGSCFNKQNRWNQPVSVCHGNNASITTKNIESLEAPQGSGRSHPGASYAGKHQATEAKNYGWLGAGNTNWHVECGDCHNAHTAGNTKHTSPGNAIGNLSPLYGTGGVSVSWTGSWPSVPGSAGFTAFESLGLTTSTAMPLNYYEYQVCFKCHSSYAWGLGTPPVSPSFNPLTMTDQAKEFNPGNTYTSGNSMHPIAGGTGNTAWGTLVAPWNGATRGSQTMYCSDCHGTNDSTASQGPHGSTNQFILKSAFTDTYSTNKNATQPTGDLCFTCHDLATYQTGTTTYNPGGTGFSGSGTNLHTTHRNWASTFASSTFGYYCVNCHVRVPHGYNTKGMIAVNTAGQPYVAGDAGAGKISTYNPGTSGAYPVGVLNRNSNCSTVNGCHQ